MLRIKHEDRADWAALQRDPWVLEKNTDFEEADKDDDLRRAAEEVG
jgi:hypothetical protein